MATNPTLALSEDFEAEFELTRKNEATGDDEPADGLTTVAFHWAAEKGGVPINPALQLDAAERTGKPGSYFVIFDTALLVAHLVTVRKAWLVVTKTGDIESHSFPYTIARYAEG